MMLVTDCFFFDSFLLTLSWMLGIEKIALFNDIIKKIIIKIIGKIQMVD